MAIKNVKHTAEGLALIVEMQLGGEFEPTKMVIGSGRIPAGKTETDMVAVVTQEVQFPITDRMKLPNTDAASIGGVFTNEDKKEDFYFREIGLYARVKKIDGTYTKEVLYVYGNSGETAELIPAYSVGSRIERKLNLIVYIGGDTEISIEIPSEVYITADRMQSELSPLQRDSHIHANINDLNAVELPLPVRYGGLGSATIEEARDNLGLGSTTGALPVANGGTGQTTITGIRKALGLGNTTGALPVANGGTGATSASGALSAIGAAAKNHAHPGTNLVSGADWQMGTSKTIANIASYVLFLVKLNGISIPLVGVRYGSRLMAMGGYTTASPGDNQRIYMAHFIISGTKVTYEGSSGISHWDESKHGDWTGYGVELLRGIV